MNKILLFEAIRQSNLHPTTKSFLAQVLKGVDGNAVKLSKSEMVDNPYTYSDSEPEPVNSKIESKPLNMELSDEAKKWLMDRAGTEVEDDEPNELYGSQFNAVDLTPGRNLDRPARHVQLSPEEQARYRRIAGQ